MTYTILHHPTPGKPAETVVCDLGWSEVVGYLKLRGFMLGTRYHYPIGDWISPDGGFYRVKENRETK